MSGLAGIGWRHAHYDEVLRLRPAVDFLEVHSENFFGEGGAALAVLEAAPCVQCGAVVRAGVEEVLERDPGPSR